MHCSLSLSLSAVIMAFIYTSLLHHSRMSSIHLRFDHRHDRPWLSLLSTVNSVFIRCWSTCDEYFQSTSSYYYYYYYVWCPYCVFHPSCFHSFYFSVVFPRCLSDSFSSYVIWAIVFPREYIRINSYYILTYWSVVRYWDSNAMCSQQARRYVWLP